MPERSVDRGWDARLSEPGSPLCTPDWLALREPADAAARSTALVAALVATLPDGPLVVADLGCGTGSMGRWLAPLLPSRDQHWRLHDRDPVVLARAELGLPEGVGTEPRLGSLADADLAGASLVTASALLDLCTADDVDRIADAVVAAGCPALLTLSVAGAVTVEPPEDLDAAFAAAFDAHQRRPVDGRRLLGPDAAPATAAAFERRGATVTAAPSPWRLGPEQAALREEWLRGWLSAACAQRPELAAHAADYLDRRRDARFTVGHTDLLVLP